ncbi:MFS transporter [Octadecabacter sp. R77987]|uniref:MFS transporter n=1 Tax=Octadecabacter sp. R77987 TaxID=3093874 RepID=UPI00366FD2B1
MSWMTFLRENAAFLFAGFLFAFTSSYGQTYFISLFAGEIRGTFGLSDGQWGGIYTLGTTASAIAMIGAGVLTDRFRARTLAVWISVGLALACLAMASVPNAVVLVGVIFALRFFGQGMMSQLSAVSMARWFVATRGRALSVASMGFSVAQAILPVIFVALLAVVAWRGLWVLAAVLVLITIPVQRRLLRLERTPSSMAEANQALGMGGKHWRRGQVLRSPLFWLMVPALLGPPAWGTALFFQQVHLTEVKGWDLVSFVALMPLFTGTAIVATFAAGGAIDRFGTKRLIPLYMLPFALSFLILAFAQTIGHAAIGLVVFGVGQGLQATIPASFWAEFFGTRHLGSIKAVAAAIMVFGSAIGPGVTGVLIDIGITFPEQMISIAVYFVLAGVFATIGVFKFRNGLPAAA